MARRSRIEDRFGVLVLLLALSAPCLAGNTVLVMGDSLSAGYGVPAGKGWVDLLGERLRARPAPWTVVNASISGDTTSGGVARVAQVLSTHRPQVVILELGGNDALRGQPIELLRRNLRLMIDSIRASGAQVLLLGMRIPPNYGPAYTRAFEEAYAQVGEAAGVARVDFFLDGVALDPGLMQEDGIHPTAEAQPRMLDNVWPALEPLLREWERST